MNTIISMVEMEVRLNYVSSSWVAQFYGVPLSSIYAAAASGRLKAVEVPAAKRNTLLFDRRTLPHQWPSRGAPRLAPETKWQREKKRRQRRLKEAA